MTIEELQKTLGKDLAIQILAEYSKTDDYMKIIESDRSFHEQKTILVLSIYDHVQRILLDKQIKELTKSSKETLINKLIDTLRDVQMFESSLYAMKRLDNDSERLDSILNEYYGMLPNEKLNLLEAIEEIVEINTFER
ncbi:hypothetical protein [Enterococcus alishanensis]